MEKLSKWIFEVIHLLIPGFVYFIDMIIILQYNSYIDFLCILEKYNNYSFGLITVIVLISYILGNAADIAIHSVYWFCHLKDRREGFKSEIASSSKLNKVSYMRYRETTKGYYATLRMARSLFISVFILYIILIFPCIANLWFIFMCTCFIIALLFGWLLFSEQVKILDKVNLNGETKQTPNDKVKD